MTHLQDAVGDGVLKRNNAIITWIDSLWWQISEIAEFFPIMQRLFDKFTDAFNNLKSGSQLKVSNLGHITERFWVLTLSPFILLMSEDTCRRNPTEFWTTPPPPHSNRIRGYLGSFPITWIPYLGGKRYTPYLGYWLPLAITKKDPLFRAFSGNLPETTAPKDLPLPEKMGIVTQVAPLCIRVGGGDLEYLKMCHVTYKFITILGISFAHSVLLCRANLRQASRLSKRTFVKKYCIKCQHVSKPVFPEGSRMILIIKLSSQCKFRI